MIDFSKINKEWTLFLDRDGVINKEKKADYIKSVDEFIFYPEVKEAIKIFTDIFNRIIIVTNQKGIGKKIMSEKNLNSIHQFMLQEIELNSGKIDKIYYCSDLEDSSPNRKPNAGMAFQAKNDFPEINFSKSIIAGNKLSDMQFGRNAGIATVFVATTNPDTEYPHPLIDERIDTLFDLALKLKTV